MLVPDLEQTPNRFWDSPIWNGVVSLPEPIWGSPFRLWVPDLSAAPIWGLKRIFPNWNKNSKPILVSD